ncbi:hypothetical protein [Thiolapillus sp.]|uniref:hypothetical protein n=2 Tax=Thiolapillus sp. TaxID=2017437 RepID=UPI003AF731C9
MSGKRHCWGHKFQRGNQKRVKWIQGTDSTASSTSAAVAVATTHGDAHSSADQPYTLRSRKSVANKCGKMRLIHVDKNCELWNFAIQWHSKMKTCSRPRFQPAKEEKRGVVVAQSLRCVNCNFTTPLFKLYEEVHKPGPGRNAAVQNIDLNAAVTSTSIGFKKLRLLLAALDLSPPSESGMHEMSQTVCDQIAELASDDMREKLIHASGPNKKVNISADTRYNTCGIRTSRRTGLLTATQATTLAIETKTGKNYIVSAFTQNKMCQKGALLRGKGDKTATCPGGHVGCTANIDRYESLSEYQSGWEIGHSITEAGVAVEHCTTDGDSRLHKGVTESMQDVNPSHQVKRLADLVHLSQTQIRYAKRKTFSDSMFPGVKKKKDREDCKYVLATDLKNRSSMILKYVSKKYSADTHRMKKEMPSIINAVLQCYSGNCSDCAEKSAGTCPGGDGDNWFVRSHSLRENRISALQPTDADLQTMRDILMVVLGDEAIEKTWGLSTTQANEAANRALSARCPKNVKFSKSLPARVGTGILTWNNGPGVAQRKISQRLGLPRSDGQLTFDATEQKKHMDSKKRTRSPLLRARRLQTDAKTRQHRLDRKRQMQLPSEYSDYRKHQLDETSCADEEPAEKRLRRSVRLEHKYDCL